MEKKLNVQNASSQMEALGLNQSDIAKALDVSRAIVSGWLRDDEKQKFPRPAKLLALGKLLELTPGDLVIKDPANEPIVAFRKRQGTVTKDHHLDAAKVKGRYLSQLVKYLPFDTFEMPPVFKRPSTDYSYLQKASLKVRHDLGLNEKSTVHFEHLIDKFNNLQAVILPVLWGKKDAHANALHIRLPDSGVTWVYLNLDANIHDFKFWMAHEYGHCLSPSLDGDEAEDFADAFAGALLFPENKCRSAYEIFRTKRNDRTKVKALFSIADKETISPYTVLKEINAFADYYKLSKISIDERYFFAALRSFNEGYKDVSKGLFKTDSPVSAKEYMSIVKEVFKTPFFDLIEDYFDDKGEIGTGFIKTTTDMPMLDVKSIYSEILNASNQNSN